MNTSNITLNNVSSKYCKYEEPYSDLEKNAKYIAVVILCVIGICSNIFIIVIAAKFTVRKNLHHLIINMVVSDALFLVSKLWDGEVSFKYDIESLYPIGVLGDIICKITHFIYMISYKVSLLTMCVISIERFRVTRRTLQRSRQYNLKQRVAVLSICWLIPMVGNAYPLYIRSFKEVGQYCFYKNASEKIMQITYGLALVTWTIVVITILALSIITVRRLSRPQDILAHLMVGQLRNRRRRSMAAVFMVITSVVLYSCCWSPYIFLKVVSI